MTSPTPRPVPLPAGAPGHTGAGAAPVGALGHAVTGAAPVGVLGCTGAVGRALVRRLREDGIGPLRLGGRDLTRVRAVASSPPATPPGPTGVLGVAATGGDSGSGNEAVTSGDGTQIAEAVRVEEARVEEARAETVRAEAVRAEASGVEAMRVDVEDAGALAAFCAGCRIVVNCAGPSSRILDTVARAALAAGAAYVDVAGDHIDRTLLQTIATRPRPPATPTPDTAPTTTAPTTPSGDNTPITPSGVTAPHFEAAPPGGAVQPGEAALYGETGPSGVTAPHFEAALYGEAASPHGVASPGETVSSCEAGLTGSSHRVASPGGASPGLTGPARESAPWGRGGVGGDAAVVLGAGMMPGLSALLPRYLAAGFRRVERLVAYVGGLDPFTPAAARDYVASLAGGYGTALAAWRGHRPVRGALRPVRGVRLPGWSGRVSAYPYLAAETGRLARALRIAEVEWWTVFDGERTLDALARAGDAEPERAAEALVRASRLEAFGREPYFQMVFEMTGDGGGRTLVVRTGQSHELSAAVAAAATVAVLRGQVPGGVHEAADVLSPEDVFRRLSADPSLTRLTIDLAEDDRVQSHLAEGDRAQSGRDRAETDPVGTGPGATGSGQARTAAAVSGGSAGVGAGVEEGVL
ncbi:saccharopine dehydrogenase NADP-binding domain-containing protein [Nonomuraea muscovyensis]